MRGHSTVPLACTYIVRIDALPFRLRKLKVGILTFRFKRDHREREKKVYFPQEIRHSHLDRFFPLREREMGIWGYVCSTSESLKWNTPDLTAVKGWGSSSYDFGLAAGTKINNVRINATQTLSQYMSDEETRSRIRQFAVDLAKNAVFYGCREGLKSVPGGTLVYKAVLRSIRGEKKFDQGHELDMKALQAEVAELKETLKSAGLVRAEKHQPCADLKSTVYKKPEDVIRVFMMKEFMGMRLLDDRSDGS
ncbi:uncharacterized protein LOC133875751 isoform X1 [Alnus glutinosa]|uniref:uncharacterized protein LOC133875751 isoform X1 n=1 Tax=Alnus glutinosa TaxID=3517 RepID=UPI002D779D96|nr:uncharacterized protein LOC133875751 isoform X1 [Alnus glutinosa]